LQLQQFLKNTKYISPNVLINGRTGVKPEIIYLRVFLVEETFEDLLEFQHPRWVLLEFRVFLITVNGKLILIDGHRMLKL